MRLFKKFLLSSLVLVSALTLVGCGFGTGNGTETVETGVNDEYTLILQSSTMDGIFNPFFYSSAYDFDVISMVNVGLLSLDRGGAVVAGDDYPTVAQDYSIYYTDNLQTYAPKETFEDGDYVVYEMRLKKDIKFSDGRPITADDVLFNYYVYLDPAYDGSSTLYTMPILGLQDYRIQVLNSSLADRILTDNGRGQEYTQNDAYTKEQFDTFWAEFEEAGNAYCQQIIDYVVTNYGTDEDVNDSFKEGHTFAEIAASENLKAAFGMGMWGYGQISDDFTTFTGASDTVYNVSDLNAELYFEEMLKANEGRKSYQEISSYESAGSDFVGRAKEAFMAPYASVGSVPTISGLVKGTKVVNGVQYETVKVVLTEQDPKAILSIGVTVAPKHYYTAGYSYKQDGLTSFGCEYNSTEFMNHLKTFNAEPKGAGPYKYVSLDEGDGTVYLERNTYFDSMGGDEVYNANIKKLAFKIIELDAEYSALEAGDIHYATVGATSTVMSNIAKQDKLVSLLVDNLGFGYICVNPRVYPNLYERIALTTLFDLDKVYGYYPSGLADVIYRSMSQVCWAYPEGAQAEYPYDVTKAAAIYYLKLAGYTFDEETQKFVGENLPTYKFSLPSAASAHPAGAIFIQAQKLLSDIGITAEITPDPSLISNIKKNAVGIYALAWQATPDPDMYQVYHYESQAESVISNGIKWLHDNGNVDELGTVEVTKLDGTTVTMNQAEALEYLAQLIEEGTKYMLADERKPIYVAALDILAQLNIEIPTYQRKNLFVYNGKVIEGSSLSQNITPYWGPLAEIWKVRFVKGTTGNQTVEKPTK
jgi:peptide/nickel transport system substrate-binding protein